MTTQPNATTKQGDALRNNKVFIVGKGFFRQRSRILGPHGNRWCIVVNNTFDSRQRISVAVNGSVFAQIDVDAGTSHTFTHIPTGVPGFAAELVLNEDTDVQVTFQRLVPKVHGLVTMVTSSRKRGLLPWFRGSSTVAIAMAMVGEVVSRKHAMTLNIPICINRGKKRK